MVVLVVAPVVVALGRLYRAVQYTRLVRLRNRIESARAPVEL